MAPVPHTYSIATLVINVIDNLAQFMTRLSSEAIIMLALCCRGYSKRRAAGQSTSTKMNTELNVAILCFQKIRWHLYQGHTCTMQSALKNFGDQGFCYDAISGMDVLLSFQFHTMQMIWSHFVRGQQVMLQSCWLLSVLSWRSSAWPEMLLWQASQRCCTACLGSWVMHEYWIAKNFWKTLWFLSILQHWGTCLSISTDFITFPQPKPQYQMRLFVFRCDCVGVLSSAFSVLPSICQKEVLKQQATCQSRKVTDVYIRLSLAQNTYNILVLLNRLSQSE